MWNMKNVPTPAYIYDADVFAKNLHSFIDAFRGHYYNTVLAYPFKTNYLPAICKTALKESCYAEVVSPMEYTYATHIGAHGSEIIYNGVCKDEQSIATAIKNDSVINADNYEDVMMIVRVGNELGKKPHIGLRINTNIGKASRFGIVPFSNEFRGAINFIKGHGLAVEGIHCHVRKARSLADWESRAKTMICVALAIGKLKYIDLGGNMYSPMPKNLADQFNEHIPSYQEYADTITPLFRKAFPDASVKLVLESGTALVANTMSLLTTVNYVKRLDGKNVAYLDCKALDLGFAGQYKDLPAHQLDGDGNEEYILTGCTCIEGDVVSRSFKGNLSKGSRILIENAGAYTNNLARNFISESPAIYKRDGDELILVKQKPRYEDFFAGYML